MRMLLIAGALLIAGCGGQPGAGPSEPSTAPTSGPAATTSPSLSVVAGPTPSVTSPTHTPPSGRADVPAALLEKVRADAARRVGVAPTAVTLVSSTMKTWPDGSLGCPEPGRSYIQVQVDGHQIIVDAGGKRLDYRTASDEIRLCE